MNVIGLTGPARAGKDTVAQIIAEEMPGETIRQGFADKLKLSAALALGYTPKGEGPDAGADAIAFCDRLKVDGEVATYVTAEGIAKPHLSGRQFLQRYGTEAHRDVFGEAFWLDAVLPLAVARSVHVDADGVESYQAHTTRDDCDLLLIPDIRFPNEAQRVLDCAGEVWRIERPDVAPIEAHASEVGIPDELVSRVIRNVGSLDDLRRLVIGELRARV